jgi:hypothetical protein
MAGIERQVNYTIAADDQTSAAVNSAREKFKGFQRELDSGAESLSSKAKSIEENLLGGSERGLRGLLKGGAVGFIGEQFDQFAEKAAELSDKLRGGEISVSEMAGDLARSVPILGSFIKGFDSVREAITGERAAIERINEEAKEQNHIIDLRNESLRRQNEAHAQTLETLQRIRNELEKIGKSGPDLAAIVQRQQQEAERAAVTATFEQQKKNEHSQSDKAIEDARKKFDEATAAKPQFTPLPGASAADIAVSQHAYNQLPGVEAYDRAQAHLNYLEQAQKRNLQQIESDKQAALTALTNLGNASRLQSDKDAAAARAKLWDDADQQLAKQRQQAQDAEMRSRGQILQADLLRNKQVAEEQIKAVDARLEAERKANPGGESDSTVGGPGSRLLAARVRAEKEIAEIRSEQALSDRKAQEDEDKRQADALKARAGAADKPFPSKPIPKPLPMPELSFRMSSANTGHFVSGVLASEFEKRGAKQRNPTERAATEK